MLLWLKENIDIWNKFQWSLSDNKQRHQTDQQHTKMQYGSASSKIQLENCCFIYAYPEWHQRKASAFQNKQPKNKKTFIPKFNKKLSEEKFIKELCVESMGIMN